MPYRIATCCFWTLSRARRYSTAAKVPQVAVVGGGAAGFYTTQQLLKGHSEVQVDIYEKLPVPFGLVRFGVAPDHPEVKNVVNTFTQTGKHDRCRFFGNVTVGRDVTVDELRTAYTAVVLAYGAEDDRMLEVPGEKSQGIFSARAFVGWYNGLPQYRNLCPDLNTNTAVVLGQGNVAIDVARILLTPVDILKKTDITDYALEALSKSEVRHIHLIGRRGPLQAAFTIAELREMIRLPGCRPVFNPSDFTAFKQHLDEVPLSRKRMMELMMKTALEAPSKADEERWLKARKKWYLTFLRSPVSFGVESRSSCVNSVRLSVNQLEGPLGETQTASPTGEEENLPCGLVLKSIGFRNVRLDKTSPFDDKRAVVPNDKGRVDGHPGLYCSGWIKRGPVGVIVATMNDAFETGKIILEDLKSGSLAATEGRDAILASLKEKGVNPVSFSDWEKINLYEKSCGERRGKPREKIVDVKEMLKVALG